MMETLQVIQYADDMRSERSIYDQTCADIAEIFRPSRLEIRSWLGANPYQEGAKRMQNVYDGAGIQAANQLGGFIYGTVANPATDWLKLETPDPDLNEWYPVKIWLERESKRVLKSAESVWSPFYSQTPQLFIDEPVFGTAIMSSELRRDKSGFLDMCRPLSECWFDVNQEGEIVTMFRRHLWKAADAVKEFGADAVSDKLRDKAKDKPRELVEILNAVMPNDDFEAGKFGPRGMPFASRYIEVEQKHDIVGEGYEEFPFFCPRWGLAQGEKYGRGHPGELALPDGRSLQSVAKSNLLAGEWAAKPAWAMPSEGVIQNARLLPGKTVFGAMNSQGKPLVAPLGLGGNVPFAEEQQQALRSAVKEFFFFSIMLLDAQKRTGMADLEILERQTERMQVMAPYIGQLITELFAPWTRRRLAMLARLKLVSPPPRELQGKSIQPAFTSPLALAQKSSEATGVLRSWNFVEQQAAVDPGVIDIWNSEQNIRIVHEAYGAPSRGLNSPDVVAQKRADRAQRETTAANLAGMQQGADAAQKGAAAMATMNGQRAA